MHSSSSLWLIAPFMSLVIGVILISRGFWRSAQHDSVKRREVSRTTILGVRAVLVSSALFLVISAGWLAFGLTKR